MSQNVYYTVSVQNVFMYFHLFAGGQMHIWVHRILVPEYGFMHLELIPMLVGFFTYKIATFIQAIEEAVTIVGEKTQV